MIRRVVGWATCLVHVQWTCCDIPEHLCLFLHLQVERFGKPTWRRLVEAVQDHNLALAQTIAREHGVLP